MLNLILIGPLYETLKAVKIDGKYYKWLLDSLPIFRRLCSLTLKDEAQTALFKDPVRTAQ